MINEGTLERAASAEPSLEVVNNNAQSTRDTITDVEATIQRIEDFLRGAQPENDAKGQVDSCPSGMLATLCQIGASNHDRLCDIHRRLTRMAGNLGASQ